MSFFDQALTILANPSATAIYYIVLFFSLEAAFALAWSHRGTHRAAARLAFASGLSGAGRLLLVGASILAAAGAFPALAVLPPLDRSVSLMTMLMLGWVLIFRERQPRADIVVGVLLLCIAVGAAIAIAQWNALYARGDAYNSYDTSWVIAKLVLSALCLVGLVIVRPPQWGLGAAIFVLLLSGVAYQFYRPIVTQNFPAAERIAELSALPLFVVLVYRLFSGPPETLRPEPALRPAAPPLLDGREQAAAFAQQQPVAPAPTAQDQTKPIAAETPSGTSSLQSIEMPAGLADTIVTGPVVDEPEPEPMGDRQPFPALALRSEFISIAVAGLMVVVFNALPALPAPLSFLRLLLGLAFVLFIPGYCLQSALFPRRDDLSGIDRLALAFGLSVALIPLVSLLLDRLPWGLRLWPITISLLAVTAACAAIALIRRWRLPLRAQPTPPSFNQAAAWLQAQDRRRRAVYAVTALGLIGLGTAGAIVLSGPRADRQFTEFYLLGREGFAQNFPHEAVAGGPVTVTVGIVNREGETARYGVSVWSQGEMIGPIQTISLDDGQTWEKPVEFALPGTGDDQEIEFRLDRENHPSPYRTLRLILDVKPAITP